MKLHYCFLERFNNYFNRKIIKFDTLLDYQNNSKNYFIPEGANGALLPFDFNPNDNVTTEIIANEVPFDPDYFLLLDSDYNIVQRWFCIEQKRNRQGQWLYQLKRDVISDNLETLENAPIYVQKGMLKEDDPFIVNDEGMSLNQIKKSEELLKDNSNTAWIIGYIAKDSGGSDINIQSDAESVVFDYITLEDIEDAVGIDNGTLAQFVNFENDNTTKGYATNKYELSVNLFLTQGIPAYSNLRQQLDLDCNPISNSYSVEWGYPVSSLCDCSANDYESLLLTKYRDAINDNKATLKTQILNILNKTYLITFSQFYQIQNFNGRIVKYNGKYYYFNIFFHADDKERVQNVFASGFTSLDAIKNQFIASSPILSANEHGQFTEISAQGKSFVLQLKYVSSEDTVPQLNTVISSGRNITGGQEFDIIALPLTAKVKDDNSTDFDCWENVTRRIASAIALKADAKCYDIQLLPYCPFQEIIKNGKLDITNLTEHDEYDFITQNISDTKNGAIFNSDITYNGDYTTGSATKTLTAPAGSTVTIEDITFSGRGADRVFNVSYILTGHQISISFEIHPSGTSPIPNLNIVVYYHNTNENVKKGIMFYISKSSFTFKINKNIVSSYSRKVESNCRMFRLVSPNYQGTFQFNLAKNGNSIYGFNVFCTYKPYTPFIKIAPEFSWLYGQEFQDNRGLICGGDFSLPRISSAWESYQLQNKNYQNIFNRDIQHLEFTQYYEMRNQLISGSLGILTDSAKGAGAGAMVGGPYGAIAGGIIGGATSGVGFGIDVDTLARTQRENKQLAIDKFNYQLGNIKALPYTLTKVGSFDSISKYFPFLEEYICSDEELEAFELKIKYESMTVMKIGTLSEYKNFNGELNYFKGVLIRNDDIADDSHILNAISEELLKGVYI